MKRLRLFVSSLLALLTFAAWAQRAPAAPIDELVAAAKKEGTIEFYAPSTLTPKGAQALAGAFNKKYGLNITLQYSPSGNMTRDIGKVVGQAATGVPPEWDLMLVTDAHHATLWLKKQLQTFDYRKLGVDPRSVHYDNGAVSFAHQFVLPAYNKKVLPAKDIPKSWEDLLDPKWKGGKLGISTATHHLSRLAVGAWGEEKGTKYVKGLVAQELILGRLGEVATRLELGEILVAVSLTDSHIHEAEVKGSPIAFAEGIEPVISPAYHAGVPKGARHSNVAHLFALFLITPEAQQIFEKYTGHSSAFISGTKAHKYAQGKKVLYMTQDQADKIDKLARQYGKILGFGG